MLGALLALACHPAEAPGESFVHCGRYPVHIDGGGRYPTIQDALDVSVDGATILVTRRGQESDRTWGGFPAADAKPPRFPDA